MTSYIVHIYRELRLVYGGIEAASAEEAACKARDMNAHEADNVDDCDGETFAALVDVAGDDGFEQSRIVDFEPERSRKVGLAALQLLDMIRHGVLSLKDGDAEFDGTVYAFDVTAPDWSAVVDAIGWENARAGIEAGATT